MLFGTLVMVTGPTVVTPLLRRIQVLPMLQTVLEAEGVIIDAVGAIVAVARWKLFWTQPVIRLRLRLGLPAYLFA